MDDVLLIFLHQCCTLHFLLFASSQTFTSPLEKYARYIKLTVSKKYSFQRFSDQMSRSLLVQQDQSRYASHFPFFASSETFRSAARKRTVTFTNRWRKSATHDTIDPKKRPPHLTRKRGEIGERAIKFFPWRQLGSHFPVWPFTLQITFVPFRGLYLSLHQADISTVSRIVSTWPVQRGARDRGVRDPPRC